MEWYFVNFFSMLASKEFWKMICVNYYLSLFRVVEPLDVTAELVDCPCLSATFLFEMFVFIAGH